MDVLVESSELVEDAKTSRRSSLTFSRLLELDRWLWATGLQLRCCEEVLAREKVWRTRERRQATRSSSNAHRSLACSISSISPFPPGDSGTAFWP